MNIKEIELRHFEKNDFESFKKVSRKNADHISRYLKDGQIFKEISNREYKEMYRRYLYRISEFEFLGGFFEGKLVGEVVLCPAHRINATQFTYWVDQDFINQGVATELVMRASEYCFKKGYWSIEVYVEEGNIESERVMEKCGFNRYSNSQQLDEDSGRIIKYSDWEKINPGPLNPFGPKGPFDFLKPRRFTNPI